MNKVTIAVDAMGGDYGPMVTVPAALQLLTKYSDVVLVLVGNQEKIRSVIASHARVADFGDRLVLRHASEEVLMDELPSKALRNKKDSSMRVAVNLVKEQIADACVSAGNTGALVATAHFVLKNIPGIDRPAITTKFPTMVPHKATYILDLGANIDPRAECLYQLAMMGSVLASVIDDIERPKVALLNIGSEDIKGNEQIKNAAQMLAQNPKINYVGFVEGDDIFHGKVDVIVCDGFLGNVVLKTVEGALKLVAFYAKRNMMHNIFAKFLAFLALPMLNNLRRDIDPGKYNGATLVGLRGIVIKSHGGANTEAFYHALENAVMEVQKQVPQKIRDEIVKISNDKVIV